MFPDICGTRKTDEMINHESRVDAISLVGQMNAVFGEQVGGRDPLPDENLRNIQALDRLGIANVVDCPVICPEI